MRVDKLLAEAQRKDLWRQISTSLKAKLSGDAFQRWFAEIEFVAASQDEFVFRVPNSMNHLWIDSNFRPQFEEAILENVDFKPSVKLEIGPNGERLPDPAPESRKKSAAAAPRAGKRTKSGSVSMNPRYTFDSFVVGPNCQFAHAASLAVANAPSRTYNPLFVYGGTGLGKTHLMQAIGQEIQRNKPDSRVIYLFSETFTNEFIDAIRTTSLPRFRKRYRQADVLLIDDIQFFAGKERSQEEFFHTFNTLFDGHKQIVLSSDRPAREITQLEDRLVSRFEWGLAAELQPPDIETRIAILRKKAESQQLQVDPDIVAYLAEHIRSNVRQLEGALIRVATYCSLAKGKVSRDQIEVLLKDILQHEARNTITIDKIQRVVAAHYDIRLADMASKRRPKNIARPRQIAMYLARQLTKSSLNEIGDAFGGRDHGTVIHACRTVEEEARADDEVRQAVNLLADDLKR